MGDMMRSDRMSLCDLYLQPDVAFEAMCELGEIGCCQFIDINEHTPLYKKAFVSEVCRCEEMERKLWFMEMEMKRDSIDMPEPVGQEPRPMSMSEVSQHEPVFEKWENDIIEMAKNQVTLMKNYLELAEMYYVLDHIGPILGNAHVQFTSKNMRRDVPDGRLVVFTGVLERSKCFGFETMLWRMSHGNILYKQAEEDQLIADPANNTGIWKVAFLAICQGEALAKRVQKVCEGYHANLYGCPETPAERADALNLLAIRINDLKKVIKKTNYHRCKALRIMAKNHTAWLRSVRKTKALYFNLNMFNLDITNKCLIGRCWTPDKDLKFVQTTLEAISVKVKNSAPSFITVTDTVLAPPTHHRVNRFTRGFQNLINAYGDSTYREVNPGLYTIITFPFLFSIMFGDVGHGFIMFAFGFWMVYYEKKFEKQRSNNEIWNIFFAGRYVITLMGLFSIFTGSVYNDILAKQTYIFPSAWAGNINAKAKNLAAPFISLDPLTDNSGMPYLYGLDPYWSSGIANNRIVVVNSLKMKLSIIIGIIHMMFGLMMSLINHLYFHHTHKIFFEFLPQILFLTCMFVYLVFMIFFKWFTYSGLVELIRAGSYGPHWYRLEFEFELPPFFCILCLIFSAGKNSAGCAPLLLIYFIDMILMGKTKPVGDNCDAYMYDNQRVFQMVLVFFSLLQIPILLLGGPLWVLYKHNMEDKHHRHSPHTNITQKHKFRADHKKKVVRHHHHKPEEFIQKTPPPSEPDVPQQGFELVDTHEGDTAEMMTHQAVHTIEFVLSTISHTASYLRLWALSLAHEQLSDMLWTMVLSKLALRDHSYLGVIRIFIIFPVWASFSVSILVLMEGLSAFLHTLRLHWVEFMSKFYMGGGYKFHPFHFKALFGPDAERHLNTYCMKGGKQHLDDV